MQKDCYILAKVNIKTMIDTIKIKELVNCIENCNSEEYVDFIKNLDLQLADFEDKIHFSEKKYTRTCIAKSDKYELILLAWNVGQKADIHNHNDSIGFVYVLEGEVKENSYNYNTKTKNFEELSSAILRRNGVSVAKKDENYFHSIENISKGKTLTLHLYQKPISNCLVLDHKTNEIVKRELSYDFE